MPPHPVTRTEPINAHFNCDQIKKKPPELPEYYCLKCTSRSSLLFCSFCWNQISTGLISKGCIIQSSSEEKKLQLKPFMIRDWTRCLREEQSRRMMHTSLTTSHTETVRFFFPSLWIIFKCLFLSVTDTRPSSDHRFELCTKRTSPTWFRSNHKVERQTSAYSVSTDKNVKTELTFWGRRADGKIRGKWKSVPTYSGWLSRLKWEKLSLTLGFFLTLFHIREPLSQNPLHSHRRIPAKRAGVPWGEKGGRQRKRRKSNRVCSISFKINQLVILFEMRPKRVSFLSLHGHPGVMLMPVGVRWSGPGDFRTGAWGQTWVYFPGQACVQKHPQQCPRCPPGADQTETVSGAKRTAGRWTAHFI